MDHSISELAKSFFQNATKFLASGCQITPMDILQERLKICHSCEHFEPKWFAGTGKCAQCGCSIEAKLRMATSECPMGKWKSVDK